MYATMYLLILVSVSFVGRSDGSAARASFSTSVSVIWARDNEMVIWLERFRTAKGRDSQPTFRAKYLNCSRSISFFHLLRYLETNSAN